MGCCEARQIDFFDNLSVENDNMMDKNINLLKVIFFIYLRDERMGAATHLLAIMRRTEDFYFLFKQYRHFAIKRARENSEVASVKQRNKYIEECKEAIGNERNELEQTYQKLVKIAQEIGNEEIQSPSEKINQMFELETDYKNQEIIKSLEARLASAIKERAPLEIVAMEANGNRPLSQREKDALKAIRTITVDKYRAEEAKIYFSDEFKRVLRKPRSTQDV